MEEKRRHRAAMGVGVGLAVIAMVLPSMIPAFPFPIAVGGFILGMAFLVWGLWPSIAGIAWTWPPFKPSFMPLADAARLAYESVEQTPMGHHVRAKESDPDAVLLHFAREILYRVPIHGRKLPSTQVMPVTDIILFSNEFYNGGNAARLMHNGQPTYEDFCVKRSDFKTALAQIKAEAANG